MNQQKSTRRSFLLRSVGTIAAGAVTPYHWTSSYARAESKNDRLNVAAIGTSIYRNRWGRKVRWDPSKEDFVDNETASALCGRKPREAYSIDKMTE